MTEHYAAKPAHERMRIVILGLSITSSWGNGHATTYRGLVRELAALGHEVLFLERDLPWYAQNRDLPHPPYCRTAIYHSLGELRDRFARELAEADFVMLGSYVPEGMAAGEWAISVARGATAFYDIDTPVTLAKLESGECEYLSSELIARFDVYLSFTGGPTLEHLESRYGARSARPLYCSFDPETYYPEGRELSWDLGYLGTYSSDRQPTLDRLMLEPARCWRGGRFAVAGPQYPETIKWPPNVERVQHIPPALHRDFYNAQKFTLNVTRGDMIRAGYSPSVRLFEAAACATPVVSDCWEGLDSFFEPGTEILIAHSPQDTLHYLTEISEEERRAIGMRARKRVMAAHTSAHRAAELEACACELLHRRSSLAG